MSPIPEISWQAAVAIVGSVVAIVTGLFGYLRSSSHNDSKKQSNLGSISYAQFSDLKDHISEIESEIKLLRQTTIINAKTTDELKQSLREQIKSNNERTSRDIAILNEKLDKITNVVMKILSDERL